MHLSFAPSSRLSTRIMVAQRQRRDHDAPCCRSVIWISQYNSLSTVNRSRTCWLILLAVLRFSMLSAVERVLLYYYLTVAIVPHVRSYWTWISQARYLDVTDGAIKDGIKGSGFTRLLLLLHSGFEPTGGGVVIQEYPLASQSQAGSRVMRRRK